MEMWQYLLPGISSASLKAEIAVELLGKPGLNICLFRASEHSNHACFHPRGARLFDARCYTCSTSIPVPDWPACTLQHTNSHGTHCERVRPSLCVGSHWPPVTANTLHAQCQLLSRGLYI